MVQRQWLPLVAILLGAVVLGGLITFAGFGFLVYQDAGFSALGDGAGPAENATDGGAGAGGDGGAGDGAAVAAGAEALPATFAGTRRADADLRQQGDLSFRDPDAGEEFVFRPKQMNDSTLPDNPYRRQLIRDGRRLMANTSGLMPEHTGSTRMSCANCHGGGSLPTTTGMVGQDVDLIPLVGTAAGYPEWTNRTRRMRNMRQRIRGCFLRSMNAENASAGLPDLDSREIVAMEAYLEWLAKGNPDQVAPYWRNLNKPTGEDRVPVAEANPVRGADLYLQHCASCHGNDGQGTAGQYPPLWGPESFNDGAGMSRLYTSAAFVREAMPYGTPHTLTNWRNVTDIAAFMNAHRRPHLDRHPIDYPATGPPDEGLYYERTYTRLGYEMNPMMKKLLVAGLPIGTEPIEQGDIPENVSRFDQPMRNVSVNTTGVQLVGGDGATAVDPANQTEDGNTSGATMGPGRDSYVRAPPKNATNATDSTNAMAGPSAPAVEPAPLSGPGVPARPAPLARVGG
jgi:thiosulfate dehydrogenase